MKSRLLLLILCAVPFVPARAQNAPESGPGGKESAPGQELAQARGAVLELAAAFSNDGFKLRDGFWFGRLEPRTPQRLAVNLFAGNQYWFCAAARPPAARLRVTVYDEEGGEVPMLAYEHGLTAAAGITAPATGEYFVEVEVLEGGASDACFLYTFK